MQAISRIYVKKLWGQLSFDWRVESRIVVLAGGNGTGKSTILRSVAHKMRYGKIPAQYEGLFEELDVSGDVKGRVEANFFEFSTQGLSCNENFCELIDDIFSSRGKTIVRGEEGVVRFRMPNGFILNLDQMSAGEQELVNLYGRAVGMCEADVYILDEPETSLHIDWQEDLLENLYELGGGMQMIVSTHSPSIVLNGWVSNVIQIESLFL